MVVQLIPANSDTSVGTLTQLAIVFDVILVLQNPILSLIDESLGTSTDLTSVSSSGSVMNITLPAPLVVGHRYHVVVSSGILNIFGVSFAGISAPVCPSASPCSPDLWTFVVQGKLLELFFCFVLT